VFYDTRQRRSLPSAKKTLGKASSLPSVKKNSAKTCRVFFLCKEPSLLSVFFSKYFFGTRQRGSLPNTRKNTQQTTRHSAKYQIPVVHGSTSHTFSAWGMKLWPQRPGASRSARCALSRDENGLPNILYLFSYF